MKGHPAISKGGEGEREKGGVKSRFFPLSPSLPFTLSRLSAMLLGTLLFGVGPVFAQDGQAERYTFDFRGMTLGEALQQLALTTGVGLVYDPALVGGLETACVARSQPVEAILRCLLKDTELDLKRLPAVAYVIRKREAADQDAS